jgi:hypothetical protein
MPQPAANHIDINDVIDAMEEAVDERFRTFVPPAISGIQANGESFDPTQALPVVRPTGTSAELLLEEIEAWFSVAQ